MAASDHPMYSFVVPVFNEREGLQELRRRVSAVLSDLDGTAEVLLVDDGSTDGSWEVMQAIAAEDERFRAIALSRNFGHQVAVSAGLDRSRGRAVVIMDADLQDPPELVPEMARRWREGNEVVYAVRQARLQETRLKRVTAAAYYRLLRRMTETDIPRDVGDFRLVDRRVVDIITNMPERSRFLRGMFAWAGFRQVGVTYIREGRHAGETKYPMKKMLRFATDGVVNFSRTPLRMALNAGFVVSALAFLLGIVAIGARIVDVFTTPGWASLLVATTFLGGIQLMVLGVIGEYVGRIYEEVKRRPLYIVREESGVAGALPEQDDDQVSP